MVSTGNIIECVWGKNKMLVRIWNLRHRISRVCFTNVALFEVGLVLKTAMHTVCIPAYRSPPFSCSNVSRMRPSCSGWKARGNAMPSPRSSNFSTCRLLLKEPSLLPSSSLFDLYGCIVRYVREHWCYLSVCLIDWILKLLPPGVSPPPADLTVSEARTDAAGPDAWKCAEKVRLLFITWVFVKLWIVSCLNLAVRGYISGLWDPGDVPGFRYLQ